MRNVASFTLARTTVLLLKNAFDALTSPMCLSYCVLQYSTTRGSNIISTVPYNSDSVRKVPYFVIPTSD